MYRGVLYRGCRWPAAVSAVVTAIVFMVPHAVWPSALVAGVGLALLREWRGSLIAPLCAHSLFNVGLFYELLRLLA
jgi:membrane protease YdiL (CAAX protease family)